MDAAGTGIPVAAEYDPIGGQGPKNGTMYVVPPILTSHPNCYGRRT